jgi:hypothetical protein
VSSGLLLLAKIARAGDRFFIYTPRSQVAKTIENH